MKERRRRGKSGKLWKNRTGERQEGMESEKPTEEESAVQERLNWQVAWRDEGKVAQALYAGEAIDEMHHLSDAGLLDEFFVFLKEANADPHGAICAAVFSESAAGRRVHE